MQVQRLLAGLTRRRTGSSRLKLFTAIHGHAGAIDIPRAMLGICGEHGGDPESVKFCHRIGLNYVSCSPFRVPIARLAAAQAAIGDGKERDK